MAFTDETIEQRFALLEQRLATTEAQLTNAAQVVTDQRQTIDTLRAQVAAASVTSQAPQAAPTSPARQQLVDTRTLGKPSSFSGELEANGKPSEGAPWTQWSFTFRAFAAAVSPRMKELMVDAGSRSDQPQALDNSVLNAEDAALSNQLYYALTLLCKGRALSIVQRVPEGGGCEAWRQMHHEFEPKLPTRFQGMLQTI